MSTAVRPDLNFDIDLDEDEVDLDAQEDDLEERRGKRGSNKREQYYPGRGRNTIRNIPIKIPLIGEDGSFEKYESKIFIKSGMHEGKRTGYKTKRGDKDRPINLPCLQELAWAIPVLLHKLSLDLEMAKRDDKKDLVKTLTEEYDLMSAAINGGESLETCFTCDLRQKQGTRIAKKLGKDKGWKHDLVKGLWPTLHQWGMIMLCEDSATCQECHGIDALKSNCQVCNGSGWKDTKRHDKEGYENGSIYQARFEFGKPQMFQKILDWSRDPEIGAIYHPKTGYDCVMIVSANENNPKWNDYTIDRKPNSSRLGEYQVLIGDPKKNKGKDQQRRHVFNLYADGEDVGKQKVVEMIQQASRQILEIPDLQNLRRLLIQKGRDEKNGGKWELKEKFESHVKARVDKILGISAKPADPPKSESKSESKPEIKEDPPKSDVKVDNTYSQPTKTIETPATPEKPITKSPDPPKVDNPTPIKSEKIEIGADTPTIKYSDLKGLPPDGTAVEFSDGLKINQPVGKDVLRPAIGDAPAVRACCGLYFRRKGPGANECISNCDMNTTMRACSTEFVARKKLPVVAS